MPTFSAPDRWSLDSWFTAFGSEDYNEFKVKLSSDVASLRKTAETLSDDPKVIAELIAAYEAFGDRLGHIAAYLGCLSADNANDEAVKADEAWIAGLEAEHTKLSAALQS